MILRNPIWYVLGLLLGAVGFLGVHLGLGSLFGALEQVVGGVGPVLGFELPDAVVSGVSVASVGLFIAVIFEIGFFVWAPRAVLSGLLLLGTAVIWLAGVGAGSWMLVVAVSCLVLPIPSGVRTPVIWAWAGVMSGQWVVLVVKGFEPVINFGTQLGEVFSYPSGWWIVFAALIAVLPLAWVGGRVRLVSRTD